MTIEIKVPEVGESVTEVYIGEWHVAEGDAVEKDEELVELESDKATFEAPAPSAGVLKQIVKKSGETATVGEVIGYLEDGAAAKEGKGKGETKEGKEKAAGGEEQPPEVKQSDAKQPEEKQAGPAEAEDKQQKETRPAPHVMPAARRLLEQHRLDPRDVKATGPGGRLSKEDVERHIEQAGREPAAQPAGGEDEEVVPMSPIRRRIARRLVEAQQNAALLTTFNEIDMSQVMALRKRHQEAFQKRHGIKLGFMSFFVKAVIDALKQTPQLNAEVRGDSIVYHRRFDIGIAISVEDALVVPVLRHAERLSFAEIEQAIDTHARAARAGKLTVEDLTGGTFTISNGGIYGSLLSTPIVNPPQSGVLGMHAIQDRPVVVNGEIVIRPMMYVALTYDHRLIDGREAVTFLRRITETIEEPSRMLIEI